MVRLFFISLALLVITSLSAQESLSETEKSLTGQHSAGESVEGKMQASTSEIPAQKFTGYFGFSWNHTIPVGDYKNAAHYGTQINFMDGAFFLTENIGVTAAWIGGGTFDGIPYSDNWTYNAALGGIILSLPFSEVFAIDVRAMTGHSRTHYPDFRPEDYKSESTAYMLSSILRFKITQSTNLHFSVEYYHTDTEFKELQINQDIRTYSVGAGIAYRIPGIF